MTHAHQIRLAVIVGAVAEIILVAPLFLVSGSQIVDTVPLPRWVKILEQFQMPGAPMILRLLHTYGPNHLAHQVSPYLVTYAAQALVMLIQATIFALVALGAISVYRVRKTRGSPA
jgi:hypothetical protein